jgi:hypothetical protein
MWVPGDCDPKPVWLSWSRTGGGPGRRWTGDRIELGRWTLSFFPGRVRRPWQALPLTVSALCASFLVMLMAG